MDRRTALRAGLVCAGALAAGCRGDSPGDDAFAKLESQLPGRLGVFAIDSATEATVGYRADKRFLMCSTVKMLTVAAVLSSETPLLERVIRYDRSDILQWAPVTSAHVDTGMTVDALCDAAITVSDNTAANLLVRLLGGPPAITAYARTIGDTVTRADRLEPQLNETAPGDERDTSTPAQMARDLRALALGNDLPAPARHRFVSLLQANTTGGECIRAGVPRDWVVADKTGSGAQGESNDVAVVFPPGRAPLVIAIFTSPATPNVATAHAHQIIARAAATAVSALHP